MSAGRILGVPSVFACLAIPAAAQGQATIEPSMPGMNMPAMTTADGGYDGSMPPVMDRQTYIHAMLDQFEARVIGGSPGFRWEGEGWAGTDYDKFWLKTEGIVQDDGRVEDGRHEFLYDRAITAFFDAQAGLRTDLDSGSSRTWAALGFQGLAPYFFNVQATGYVSDDGHFAGHLEASYDLLIMQRLILQPEAEINLYTRADPDRGVGSGLSDIDSGLRLRYEFSRKFAPYIGVVYAGKFGETAKFAHQSGESAGDVRSTIGIRCWF